MNQIGIFVLVSVKACSVGQYYINSMWHRLSLALTKTGVSIIFKIRVFYKALFEGFEFFIVRPYAVFHNKVFYNKVRILCMYFNIYEGLPNAISNLAKY